MDNRSNGQGDVQEKNNGSTKYTNENTYYPFPLLALFSGVLYWQNFEADRG